MKLRANLALLLFAFLLSDLSAQAPWNQLTLRSPLPTGSHYNDAEFLNGRFVTISATSGVFSSVDGTSWTRHAYPENTVTAQAVSFFAGKYFLSLLNGSNLLTGTTLDTLTLDTSVRVGRSSRAMKVLNGRLVVLGIQSDVSFTSDGENWTTVDATENTTAPSAILNDITYANGTYVLAASRGLILTSPDLQTWTQRENGLPADDNTPSFVFSEFEDGQFILGAQGQKLLTSPDGIAWTSRTIPDEVGLSYLEIIDGTYYFSGSGSMIQKSTDLVNFEGIAVDSSANVRLMTHNPANNTTLLAGRSGLLRTSTDRETWTDRRISTFPQIRHLTFDGSRFLGLEDNDKILQSTDGLSWSLLHTSPESVSDFIFADGRYVLVNFRGQISQSVDGNVWSPFSADDPEILSIQTIKFLNEQWFIYGFGDLWRSANLTDWTRAILPPVADEQVRISEMTFGNGVYLAGTRSGAIYSSTDGTNFVRRESGLTRDVAVMAFGNDRFVAGSNFGDPTTSLDGINWEVVPSNGLGQKGELRFVDGVFVNAGRGGFDTSADGLDWQSSGLETNGVFFEFAQGNNRAVAIGGSQEFFVTDEIIFRALTVEASGGGSVEISPPTGPYQQGQEVTLTPVPGADRSFAGWSGDATGSANPLTVVMDADKIITATFEVALSGYALWRINEFNAAERNNDLISGPNADPDQDGQSNSAEYYFATRPKIADALPITISKIQLGAEVFPVITWQRRKGVNDLTSFVEVSGDLQSWSHNGNAANPVTTETMVEDQGNTELVSHRLLRTFSVEEEQYLRIRIE